jgi:Flp pilus assembly pilin Flp
MLPLSSPGPDEINVFEANSEKEISMVLVQCIRKFHREESGQDLVEYALVLVAIASGVFAGSASLAGNFATWIGSLQTKINNLLQ